jgi:hypothetical protein
MFSFEPEHLLVWATSGRGPWFVHLWSNHWSCRTIFSWKHLTLFPSPIFRRDVTSEADIAWFPSSSCRPAARTGYLIRGWQVRIRAASCCWSARRDLSVGICNWRLFLRQTECLKRSKSCIKYACVVVIFKLSNSRGGCNCVSHYKENSRVASLVVHWLSDFVKDEEIRKDSLFSYVWCFTC